MGLWPDELGSGPLECGPWLGIQPRIDCRTPEAGSSPLFVEPGVVRARHGKGYPEGEAITPPHTTDEVVHAHDGKRAPLGAFHREFEHG